MASRINELSETALRTLEWLVEHSNIALTPDLLEVVWDVLMDRVGTLNDEQSQLLSEINSIPDEDLRTVSHLTYDRLRRKVQRTEGNVAE